MSINARNKGHSYERRVAETFRQKGYPDCVCSRAESKNMDDAGVDLCFTGDFMIQCKAVERLSPSPHDILNVRMPKNSKNLLFWKKNRKGSVVCMGEELFFELLEAYNANNKSSR